jgi:hypothetical protein
LPPSLPSSWRRSGGSNHPATVTPPPDRVVQAELWASRTKHWHPLQPDPEHGSLGDEPNSNAEGQYGRIPAPSQIVVPLDSVVKAANRARSSQEPDQPFAATHAQRSMTPGAYAEGGEQPDGTAARQPQRNGDSGHSSSAPRRGRVLALSGRRTACNDAASHLGTAMTSGGRSHHQSAVSRKRGPFATRSC